MPNIETVLRDHVTLNVDCVDRLYLNGYVSEVEGAENPPACFMYAQTCAPISALAKTVFTTSMCEGQAHSLTIPSL